LYKKKGIKVINIIDVNKSFKDTKVLKDINLNIRDDEVFGLVGPSGVGKSTLLNCMVGLEKYQSGSIVVDDIRLEELNELRMRQFRKNIGMIFQNFSLIGRKDAFHNIALPMECWNYSKADIKNRVEELAELTGIQDKLKNRPAELSGGQKQRVAIARALAMNPRYLFCDECTSALDPKSTIAILDLIKNLQKQFHITVVVITHEMSVVQNICNRMAILENGQVSLMGDVKEIFEKQPEQLRNLIGEDDRKVSVTMDVEDFAKIQSYLDKNKTQYKISGGI
jgi:methionine import ATP-binding protein metN